MYFKNCKLLPLINPNFTMLNTPEELIELLKESPPILLGEYPVETTCGFYVSMNKI